MKHKDDSLEWHDENELVRRLDVVEAVLNLADTIDDVVNVIMSVPSYKVQITTNTAMGSDNISTKADRNCSEKPNNCKYLTNPSGDVWECGCCLEIFCEHQIYDRNPDGTLNIVECGYEPKTVRSNLEPFRVDEPQTEEWYTFQDEQEYNAQHGKE